ncbi:MAG TPA: hypothetical protein VGI85_13325 [Chthoniobacterales bacterium]|jgi:hypothetical protein
MIPTPQISRQDKEEKITAFWKHILEKEELRDRSPLEKILAGCEIIAALDDLELLAA